MSLVLSGETKAAKRKREKGRKAEKAMNSERDNENAALRKNSPSRCCRVSKVSMTEVIEKRVGAGKGGKKGETKKATRAWDLHARWPPETIF